ncbi:uncharacterized protein LOC119957214 isoform X3 [Scyliorhinus canicula]|uniref:uncharacterized protein LOC119957214 isoform X3 n=1 Tax=Scyliorhinus canicula TaxID=7830 RepID=UPI0018F68462|nr:uncharacterized protein LOC119957214 isoform X3 [Scyliorhinus canicula]
MAACGYLLLLTCVLGHLAPELARLPEGRILYEGNTHRQHGQISMMGRRGEPPPKLHGDHPRKVPLIPEAEQQKNSPLQFRHRRRRSHLLHPRVNNTYKMDEDGMVGHKEYYLPRPPSRMHSHVYQDPTFRNDWNENHGRSQDMNRMPHYESFEKTFEDLEDERYKQANKHHKTGHQHEHKHEQEHNHEHQRGPVIEHNNYWIIGQKRFRMIVIIILAVIVCFIIILIIGLLLQPKKNVKEITWQKVTT